MMEVIISNIVAIFWAVVCIVFFLKLNNEHQKLFIAIGAYLLMLGVIYGI